MNLGDLVVRKSYGGDVTFRVENIVQSGAVIKGTEFRLLADAPGRLGSSAAYPYYRTGTAGTDQSKGIIDKVA